MLRGIYYFAPGLVDVLLWWFSYALDCVHAQQQSPRQSNWLWQFSFALDRVPSQ
jgi:hypothetical protein